MLSEMRQGTQRKIADVTSPLLHGNNYEAPELTIPEPSPGGLPGGSLSGLASWHINARVSFRLVCT